MIWVKLEPPSNMADMIPTCTEFPPASINIAGITVSISMKFWAKARKAACQRKAVKLC